MNSFNAICIAEFYTNTSAQAHFHARLVYVLNHVHTTLGKPWRELNEYIFGFEAENEAMIGDVSSSQPTTTSMQTWLT